MTQEIKHRLEQAAEKWYGNTPGDRSKNIFKHGAQTILENPGEFGLSDSKQYYEAIDYVSQLRKEVKGANSQIHDLKSQLTKCREALEKLVDISDPDTQTFEGGIESSQRST